MQVPFRLDTFKSLATQEAAAKGTIDYQIGGYISTETLDKQNEKIIQKGIDFTTYANHRRLKWEHDNSAKANIGFAEKIELRKSDKGDRSYMMARIYAVPGTAQYEVAEAAIGDIKNIIAYNEKYPNSPKDLGFSVEGGKLAKSGNEVTKSIVTNVVLTTCPINTGAVVDFFKSFVAGSSVLPMSGTEALRPEHLDGNLSTNNIKTKMKNIKTKDEAVTFFKSQGKTDEEANLLAEGWNKENESRLNISKSIDGAIEKLEKAVTDNNGLATKVGETNFETMTKSMTDSLKPNSDNQINSANVISESVNVQVELAKSQLSRDVELIKSNGLVLDSIKENMSLMKSLVDNQNEIKDGNAAIIEANEQLAKSINKVDTGVSTEDLAGETVTESASTETKPTEPEFTQKQVIEALQKSGMNFYDKGDRNASNEIDKMLGTAQAFNYNVAAEGFPVKITDTVREYYK